MAAKVFALLLLVSAGSSFAGRVLVEKKTTDNNYLSDEKNVVNIGAMAGMGGIGNDGIPYGALGGGVGSSTDVTGSGFSGVGSVIGTGPQGNFAGFGTLPTGFHTIGTFPNGGLPGLGGAGTGNGIGTGGVGSFSPSTP
ncbi:hypothetical protein M569_06180 [Genlisea aurea]|uniref:Glycine-rich protein n=1 Tax=Genlisea aurea TaxID=192259 RepID=S8CPC2_9LAMI|nr:hypothetical protein M569_06180 [Genlisea aurea]